MNQSPSIQPFLVKDCALAAIATGERAVRLDEFRDKLARIHIGCVYHHFWGSRLHNRFAHPDYHNDFSFWAHHGLHDDILAERLNILDPNGYKNLEDLRLDLLEVVDTRLEEQDFVPVSSKDNQFYFIRSNTIVFGTPYKINHPSELSEVLAHLPTTSIFLHFIEARRRTPTSTDDFSTWLLGFNGQYAKLINELKEIDPYFHALPEIKRILIETFNKYFKENSFSKPK